MCAQTTRRLRFNFLSSCGLIAGVVLLAACGKQEPAAATSAAKSASTTEVNSPSPAPAAKAPAAAASAPAAANIAKVKGRWLRPDGGYILAITTIEADGRAEAGYFNPNPIKVAWATVTSEGAETKVKVELRDTNYPGCLYKLNYLADKDRMVGTYFQAQMQQTYDVEFVREP
jgi:hypothetical protein